MSEMSLASRAVSLQWLQGSMAITVSLRISTFETGLFVVWFSFFSLMLKSGFELPQPIARVRKNKRENMNKYLISVKLTN